MAETHEPPSDETSRPDTSPAADEDQRDWSQWERQKLDLYRREQEERESGTPREGQGV
jgi:hypothetical protein